MIQLTKKLTSTENQEQQENMIAGEREKIFRGSFRLDEKSGFVVSAGISKEIEIMNVKCHSQKRGNRCTFSVTDMAIKTE